MTGEFGGLPLDDSDSARTRLMAQLRIRSIAKTRHPITHFPPIRLHTAHTRSVFLLIATALCWSLGGVLIKSIDWPPLAVAGGRGFIAALFLGQLDQFVLALGVPFSVRTLVQAAALAVGVAIYTVNWRTVRMWIAARFGGNSKTASAVT